MGRLRQDSATSATQRPLRVLASGTLFLTHTLSLPTHPEPSSVVRASSVSRSRGGSVSTCLSILAQFPSVDALLVAPLGGNEDGKRIIRDLEKERVSTRFCKVWDDAGVPTAWVLHADDTDSRTVINNNPLPDITHDEFVSLLGPLLAPENYAHLSSPPPPQAHPASPTSPSAVNTLKALQPRPSTSSPPPRPPTNTNSPAPFDWVHFEGRSVKTTLSNIIGLDGLARERKWRSHCVFSIDVGRRTRQGVEALIPHSDIVFLNKHYARAHSPQYAASPRAFLLSLTALAPPHALLVAHWGEDGAAVLSVPTREYFQSSRWVAPEILALPDPPALALARDGPSDEIHSIRTESDFWAGQHTDSSSVYTAGVLSGLGSHSAPSSAPLSPQRPARTRTTSAVRPREDGDSSDSDGTQIPHARHDRNHAGADRAAREGGGIVDEVGAQDAFMAGMMFALTRRLLPGEPYTPSATSREGTPGSEADREKDKGRWRLEECLRFATELAGRKARKEGWEGLAEDMTKAGWFDG